MNLILIGYRGSGKTSIGKKLSDQLWKDFADSDIEVCKRFGNDTIAAIWEEHGEPAWREMEVEVVRELCGRSDLVIGLGGGAVMQPGAREAVKKAADTKRIYLECSAEELHRRITADPNSKDTRPALTTDCGGLKEVETLLEERDPVYRAVADEIFDVTNTSIDETIRFLIARYL